MDTKTIFVNTKWTPFESIFIRNRFYFELEYYRSQKSYRNFHAHIINDFIPIQFIILFTLLKYVIKLFLARECFDYYRIITFNLFLYILFYNILIYSINIFLKDS